MKKAVFALSLALAFAVAGSTQAFVLINANSSDDGAFIGTAYSKLKSKIDINTTNFVNEQIFSSSNTGGSSIKAGDDVVNASITSDDATSDVVVAEEVGSVVIETEGCGCSEEAEVNITGNSTDDGVHVGTDTKESEDELKADSTNFVNRNIAAVTDAGNMSIEAGEDVDTASIETGKSIHKLTLQIFTGGFLISRK